MALWKARGGSLNKDLEFRSWHCGRRGKFKIKNSILDHGIVEGKGGKRVEV